MPTSYDHPQTADPESITARYARMLTAIAQLLGSGHGLATPASITNHVMTRWYDPAGPRRLQLQVHDLAALLAWADHIGARELLVVRGGRTDDGLGASFFHVHALGTLDGVPIVMFTGLDDAYNVSVLPTCSTITVDAARAIDGDEHLTTLGKSAAWEQAAQFPEHVDPRTQS